MPTLAFKRILDKIITDMFIGKRTLGGKYFSICPPKLNATVLKNQGRVFFKSQVHATFF